jgi:hypothetical protein
VLIVLYLAVIALAFFQQPIFLKITARVASVAARLKERSALCGKTVDSNAAAGNAAVTGIEMQNNPSHAANRTGGGAAEAATKIEIRGNPLVSAAGAGALGVEVDHVEDEQLGGGAENAQLRSEIEKLKLDHEREITQLRAEIEQLNQAQPGAVVELGVAAEAAPDRAARVCRIEAQNAISTAVDIEPPRRIDGDGSFTQEQFIAHYGGVDEWNAALPVQIEAAKTWFYADHGPYTLAKLQRWLKKKQLEATTLVRNGREGEDVELGSLS